MNDISKKIFYGKKIFNNERKKKSTWKIIEIETL